MKKREYSFGVYYYVDTETGLIDYIGFDSHIDSLYNRNYQHLNRIDIHFDKVLQNNPDRWEYHVFKKFDTLEEANKCEFDLINLYRPRFNFKHGGINGKKFYQDFEYNITKAGKNGFCIRDRNHKTIKYSKNKDKLIPLAEGLNDGYLTEEEVKTFKYTISKVGFHNGKQNYCIRDRNNKSIKNSVDKDKLIPLAEGLNDGYLTEDDVRKINLNPFKYNVTKSGKDGFDIYGVDRKRIKRSKDKDKLEKVVDALNNNVISEEKVKSTRGVDKLLKLIMEE